MFGRTSNHREYTTTRRHNRVGHRWGGRRDPDRVAGGYKAALRNPNTTRDGRERAKAELRAMVSGPKTRHYHKSDPTEMNAER
ncbi:hypothetical protein PUNSTDRAFT_50922 [Punctularia strigosozonata HHB-11173 SS5]|uniref:uncharacterized protein n=1 Tax=Punctularia strigosozonata (strain HHB-11173) TaxID=741275 RepID=UPI0004416A4B|nr:uncharacterized protein PUNSTDRAFT_50922 [Punctularia strigosozonata HHB-11173 SS5]EIN10243.1 hypothetical protein PUNSTDRAFT_50922 [Punctularia strigosozonata HHB-11173 SS5]